MLGHVVAPCIEADPWVHFTVATVRSFQLEFRSALIPIITGAPACTLCPFDLEADDTRVCTMSAARSGNNWFQVSLKVNGFMQQRARHTTVSRVACVHLPHAYVV
jgi:hypothetical protein